MPSIIIELHNGHVGPIELQTPPEKTAAKVLDACSREFNRGIGSLSPKGKPNLLVEDDDVVAGGVTYVFTPSAGSQGQAFSPPAARPDKPASSFAEFLQGQAGKQQMAAGAGSVISLPWCVSLMGLSRYGRQLFVRPSYNQLKDKILQLRQASGTYGEKLMIISGTPGIGKSFCALYMASYWIAQGTRVVYEFHDQNEAASVSWYHFSPNSGEGIRILLEQDVDQYVRGFARYCAADPHSGVPHGSDSLFHMSCHGLLERGHPIIVFATQSAAQLVFYKLGGVARYRQLAWFHGAAGHAHWQGARGYWFERLAHQVLANGGEHTFRLVGSDILYTLALPRATVFEFGVVRDLVGKFVANSMDVYAQPKYSNFPTFDSLNCGGLWFQVTVAKKHSEFMGGVKALQAAALPTCNLNNFVHPTLHDNSKPIHMIVTTPDKFDTCCLKQKQSKDSLFQRGVMKLDLSSAFGQLQHKLGNSASGLENVEAMQLIQLLRIDVNHLSKLCTSISRSRSVSGLLFVP